MGGPCPAWYSRPYARRDQSLYATSSLAIKVGGRVGTPVPSLTGIKQGCPFSPTLFGLFLDGLHRYIAVHCPHIGPALSDGTRVSNLQYADDVTLLACDPTHLSQTLTLDPDRLCG